MSDCHLKTKRLLLIIASLRGGGAERVMVNMANYWAERGVKITLLTLDDPMLSDNYEVHPLVKRVAEYHEHDFDLISRGYIHIKRVLGIRKIIKSFEPDSVLSFMTSTNVMTILASMGTGTCTFVSERTDPRKHNVGSIWAIGRRYLYKYADCVIAQTPDVNKWLLSNTKATIQTIPNFIPKYVNASCVESGQLIVAVGRLGVEKGFDLLIRAFSKVVLVYPDWRLVILGEGKERANLQTLAFSLGVDSNVEFPGFVKDPLERLRQASIAVQPSRYEGFPNALLEEMALGIAVIASRPAGEMLIVNEVNGLLVTSENTDELTLAIRRLIENPKLRVALGNNAIKVKDSYSQEKIMKLWETVLFA